MCAPSSEDPERCLAEAEAAGSNPAGLRVTGRQRPTRDLSPRLGVTALRPSLI